MSEHIKTRPIQFTILIFCLILLSLPIYHIAHAQTEGLLKIRLSRNFGYSSGTGRIQGLFTIKASGPLELSQVFFYLDAEIIGESAETPFHLRFHTDDYSLGDHTIHALGYTRDGRELESNQIQVIFVNAEEGWQAAQKIMIPILSIVFGIIILSIIFAIISGRKTKQIPLGTQRNYGIWGGAVCKRCARPFKLMWYMPNLGVKKLARCPFCGKWGLYRSLPLEKLRTAEANELQTDVENAPLDEEQTYKEALEDSRFMD